MDKNYINIREQAFSITARDINLCLDNDEQVYASIVDIPINENISTLFCSFDGSVSMYYSNGRIDIGLGQKEEIRKAAMSLLFSSGQCLPYMDSPKNHIIDRHDLQVFLFYRDGIKAKKINIMNCNSKNERFINFLVQNVLTAIRIN